MFILLDLQRGAQGEFAKKRSVMVDLGLHQVEYASSDFQLRVTMEQYKHDLSGHNLALRIQKYTYVMYVLSFSAFLGIF